MSFGVLDEQNVCSRKQSASDLQSRLKTRKLLGVGELARDNGEIYRSKISQLLGINESLYVRLPRGLLYWNSINTLYFYLFGALCILIPSIGLKCDLGMPVEHTETAMVGRMYGVVLISFGLLFRSILLQRETRSEIATLLLVTATLHALQLIVAAVFFDTYFFGNVMRLVMIIGNLGYHNYVDCQGGLYRQLLRIMDDYSFVNSPVAQKKSMTSGEKSKDE